MGVLRHRWGLTSSPWRLAWPVSLTVPLSGPDGPHRSEVLWHEGGIAGV
ncbi:hypothetical protein GS535_04330 [Saccharibacter sp. EH611]|nr:hypothetical protein [Saccharibacter sp. EH611]